MAEYQQLLIPLVELVRSTGEFIREESSKFDRSQVEFKGVNDMVSYVDRTSEEKLVEGCLKLVPGSAVIGEEGGEREGNPNARWIMDPLDGTTNFIHGLPAYCISIAFEAYGELAIGIIYDVPNDHMFTAVAGQGAFHDGEKMIVGQAKELSGALLATGFPYAEIGTYNDYLSVFRDFVTEAQGVRRFGSAALDLAWLARGRFDGFYEIGLNSWDVAAGILLVKEAGGVVSDFYGGEDYLFGKQIVAAGPGVHAAMLEVIRRYFK